MTLDEFYTLSPDESMKIIKDESRSQAKRRLCGGAVFLILIIIAIIYFIVTEQVQVRIIYVCQFSIWAFAAGWYAVNNFRYFKMVDSLNTPENMLYWYEKTINNNRNAYYLGMLGLIGNIVDPYSLIRREWGWIYVQLTIGVALLALVIYSYFKGDYWRYKTDRDDDIIDRLQDLSNRK